MDNWKDRKFDFDFPVVNYHDFIERLKDTSPKLHFIVHSTRLDFLTKRINDKWSIQEHVGHLHNADTLFMGRLDDYLNNRENLRPADLSGGKTDAENYNEKDIKFILKAFDEKRNQYISDLEKLDVEIFARTAFHPRLKQQMRLCDMLYFQAEHDLYHLNRISKMIDHFENEE